MKARLVNNAKDCKNWVSRPSLVSQKIFSRNFGAIHEIKPSFMLDKPIYVGFSILDLSKLLMYEFHRKYTGVNYGTGSTLLFKDTDSLIHEIETDDVYEDFHEDRSLFYFSDYPKDFQFYDPVNKKCFVKWKMRERLLMRLWDYNQRCTLWSR